MRTGRKLARGFGGASLLVAAACTPPPTPAPHVETEAVNLAATGDAMGDAGSWEVAFVGDGTQVVLVSLAGDLGPTDTNGMADLYLRDRAAGTTTLLTPNAAGTDAASWPSVEPVVSPDGARVAFTSLAPDLGPTDTNQSPDVYVHELATGTTTLVSANAAGTDAGRGGSRVAGFGADGATVLFTSDAYDLGPTDTNGTTDVYLRDLATGTTTLVSADESGTDSGDGASGAPTSSPDGTTVAFVSSATDLEATDTDAEPDVFVRDLAAGTTELASVSADGSASGQGRSGTEAPPDFSPDGRSLAFESEATDLVPGITQVGFADVYVRDLDAGTTTLVSVERTGTTDGNRWSGQPSFGPDGTAVLFQSEAGDLTDIGGPGIQVFVRDLAAGTTELVSVTADGTAGGNSSSYGASWSPDGERIAFTSAADDLGPTDSPRGTPAPVEDFTNDDVYVRDLATGVNTLVSAVPGGADSGNGPSSGASFGPDGHTVAYSTLASNLGITDTNGDYDVVLGHLRSAPRATSAG